VTVDVKRRRGMRRKIDNRGGWSFVISGSDQGIGTRGNTAILPLRKVLYAKRKDVKDETG
jgi:hypothetical protein